MATFALTDAEIYADEYDLSCDTNQVGWDVTVDELDDTTFCDEGSRSRIGGLRNVALNVSGFRDSAAALDADQFANLAEQRVLSTAVTDDAGAVGYFARLRKFSYQQTAQIGELAGFAASGSGSDGIGAVRGQLLFPRGTVDGAASGTGFQLGAVLSSEKVYTAIHVFSAGTTADVIVESDDNSSFTSATARSTTEVTAVGGTFVTPVAGAIADTYWRVRFADVTGEFSIAVLVGIQ